MTRPFDRGPHWPFVLCLTMMTCVWIAMTSVVRGDDPKDVSPKRGPKLELTPWLDDFQAAERDALIKRRPLLVRVGGEACVWCERLEQSIKDPRVQRELRNWTIVYLDLDKSPQLMRKWSINGIPAMRAMTQQGRIVKAQDGFLDADDLVTWLSEQHQTAMRTADDALFANHEPSTLELLRVIKQFGDRDATIREAAVRRLAPFPKASGAEVLRAFQEGSLAAKLTAFELLSDWRAPLDGIDPWNDSTLTEQRNATLTQWAAALSPSKAEPQSLSHAQIVALNRDIDRMLVADLDAARRIARLGETARDTIIDRLADAENDLERQRLLAVRYRIAAPDILSTQWPGGLDRLANSDSSLRRRAAEELAKMANEEMQPLLLELFSDADPLVRELSLRGLRVAGGKRALAALVELVKDPEPNVRAAVLKQLAEEGNSELVPQIVEYMEGETDPDLLVHGIRFLKESNTNVSVRSLFPLLKHAEWQVRAEAAAALVAAREKSRDNSNSGMAKSDWPKFSETMMELLGDPDSFVVSQAVRGAAQVGEIETIDPLVGAAAAHPQLAALVVKSIADSPTLAQPGVPHMRKFFQSDLAQVRAAAIDGLVKTQSDRLGEELLAGMTDPESVVRRQSALGMLDFLNTQRPNNEVNEVNTALTAAAREEINVAPPSITSGLLSRIFSSGPPELKDDTGNEVANENTADAAPANPPMAKHLPPLEEQPVASPPIDRWLAHLATPAGAPSWAAPLVVPLEQMVAAEDDLERLSAAMALTALGKNQTPLVLDILRTKPHLDSPGFQILSWVPWEERSRLFWSLQKTSRSEDSLASLIHNMTSTQDKRLSSVLWELLSDREESSIASIVNESMKRVYFGSNHYNLDSVPMRKKLDAKAAFQLRANSGNGLQRLVGLNLLGMIDPASAADGAASLANDESIAEDIRHDALQLHMALLEGVKRTRAAIAAIRLQGWRQPIGLRVLSHGASQLRTLRHSEISVASSLTEYSSYGSSARAIIPQAPVGLAAEDVRRLLNHHELEVRGIAGYLLTLFEDRSGLAPLLEYAHSQPVDPTLDRLVYRSIAALDASDEIGELRQIYSRIPPYSRSDFYWTIRIMSGPEILAFRKQIRDEVGVSNL